MTSEKRVQKFHTHDVSLIKQDLGSVSDWLKQIFSCGTANQKHHSDLGSDASSVWNFCACFSDFVSWGNQWWHCVMSAVFSDYTVRHWNVISHRNASKNAAVWTFEEEEELRELYEELKGSDGMCYICSFDDHLVFFASEKDKSLKYEVNSATVKFRK